MIVVSKYGGLFKMTLIAVIALPVLVLLAFTGSLLIKAVSELLFAEKSTGSYLHFEVEEEDMP